MVSVSNLDFDSDLPLSNEPELETSLHLAQMILLLTCLEWWWQDRQDFFAAGNLSIYYQPEQFQSSRFRGPDFFVVLGTERRLRNSWVVAREGGKFPNLIVEILSPKTARIDKVVKKQLYQDLFKTPEYFWFNPAPSRLEFKGFRLQMEQYQEIVPNSEGWLWSEQLNLYFGVAAGKLRYFTLDGVMIPNFEEESAQHEQVVAAMQRRLEQERQRAEQERQWAERLAERLRSLGIDPDQV
jgi:Uma2 family endonuclease